MLTSLMIFLAVTSSCVVKSFASDDSGADTTVLKIAGHANVESCDVSADGLFDECQKYLDRNHTNFYYKVKCKVSTLEAPQRVCLFTNIVDPANLDPYQRSAPVPRVNDGGYCEMRVTGVCYNVCTKIQSKLAHHDGKPVQFTDGRTYVCNYPRVGGIDNKYVCGCAQSATPA